MSIERLPAGRGKSVDDDAERRARATLAAWCVGILGQTVGPVYAVFVLAMQGWADSYDGNGSTNSFTDACLVVVAVTVVAWFVQLGLTARRRALGSWAVSGFVFLVLGVAVGVLCGLAGAWGR